MPDIMANGIRIHYERTGGDKPPVVLCHGIRDSGQCWPRVEAALKPTYDLIMLDARGHGRSEAPPTGYSQDIMTDDVAAVITALGLEQPAVIGHSMGAMTVANLAARYPDLVRCIVLEDPPWPYPEHTAEEWAAAMDGMRAGTAAHKNMTTEEMVAHKLRIDPGVALWDAGEVAPWSEAKRNVSLSVMDGMRGDPWHWREIVTRIVCPALLLTGDPAKGVWVKPAIAQQVQALNPRIQIVSIPQVGHDIRRQGFAAYIDAVSTFLRAHMVKSEP